MEAPRNIQTDLVQNDNNQNGNEHINSHYYNYEALLNRYDILYSHNGPYLQAGENAGQTGWVIYISVVKQQIAEMLEAIFPILESPGITFTIPESSNVHDLLLQGGLGYDLIGKIITIYPGSSIKALPVVERLLCTTKIFNGPDIPAAKHLGSCVYSGYDNQTDFTSNINKDDRTWPFQAICREPKVKVRKLLNRKYLILETLKGDVKGNVYKGLNISKWSNIHWCLIKQGKFNQCYDDAGRTIKDRLQWQYGVQSELDGLISIPHPIDFFDSGNDAYLIMEFIDGNSLNDILNILQKGKVWFALEKENQTAIINLLLKLVGLIQGLHTCGFIHRDLSPVNFMITKDNRVVAIDIELCYNYKTNHPEPFFTLGTPGYMSPAQTGMKMPVIEDDLFGIGGLLIKALTGISPTKLSLYNTDNLYADLNYFIGNQRIAILICSSLSDDPGQRPNLDSIKHALEVFYSVLLTGAKPGLKEVIITNDFPALKTMIDTALKSFWQRPLANKDGKWHSKTVSENLHFANESKSLSYYPGFFKGASGIIYLFTIADYFSLDLSENRDAFYLNFNEVKSFFEVHSNNCDPGLNNGAAGFCVVLATLIKYGQLERGINYIDLIVRLLSLNTGQLNVANGIAGQGLAMMTCAELLEFPNLASKTSEIAEKLTSSQNRDGSWSIKQDSGAPKGVKLTGLFHGIAGITYFLLIYGTKFYSEQSRIAAKKSLNWLLKQRLEVDGCYVWKVNSENGGVDPWLEYGFTGIAFLFIKAFELLELPEYKAAAKSALLSHPKFISSNYLSQANGLSGLGEVYLEAYRVFKEPEWYARASHIVNIISHSGYNESTLYWLDGSDTIPTADFMVGNSGIVHFLLRYHHPDKIGFHLFQI